MDDSALLELAAGLAHEAGAVILAVRARGFETLRKADRSPVTEADHAAEALILRGLRAATPGIPVIAEEEVEAGLEPDASHEYWLVDPLDGTREFSANRDEFTVNIGLVRDGRAVLGAVGVPAYGEMFGGLLGPPAVAWKQTDAGRVAIQARNPPDAGMHVLASRQHAGDARLDDSWRAATSLSSPTGLGAEDRAPGRGRRRHVSAIWPHHGVGHRGAAGDPGGGRRPVVPDGPDAVALRQARLGQPAIPVARGAGTIDRVAAG